MPDHDDTTDVEWVQPIFGTQHLNTNTGERRVYNGTEWVAVGRDDPISWHIDMHGNFVPNLPTTPPRLTQAQGSGTIGGYINYADVMSITERLIAESLLDDDYITKAYTQLPTEGEQRMFVPANRVILDKDMGMVWTIDSVPSDVPTANGQRVLQLSIGKSVNGIVDLGVPDQALYFDRTNNRVKCVDPKAGMGWHYTFSGSSGEDAWCDYSIDPMAEPMALLASRRIVPDILRHYIRIHGTLPDGRYVFCKIGPAYVSKPKKRTRYTPWRQISKAIASHSYHKVPEHYTAKEVQRYLHTKKPPTFAVMINPEWIRIYMPVKAHIVRMENDYNNMSTSSRLRNTKFYFFDDLELHYAYSYEHLRGKLSTKALEVVADQMATATMAIPK